MRKVTDAREPVKHAEDLLAAKAIQEVVEALAGLDGDQQQRVLHAVAALFGIYDLCERAP